jgi:eIF3 subunit 6 N terminal domain
MAQYDLTPILSKFFDRHLIIPLLEFLGGRGVLEAFLGFASQYSPRFSFLTDIRSSGNPTKPDRRHEGDKND